MSEYVIYKYVYHGEIIYIGKSDYSLKGRIAAHSNEEKFQPFLDSSKVYFFNCNNPAETAIYELILINKYKPVLNSSMKYYNTRTFDIEEPKWHKLSKDNKPLKHLNREADYILKINDNSFIALADMVGKGYIRKNDTIYTIDLSYKEYDDYKGYHCVMDINRIIKNIVTTEKDLIKEIKLTPDKRWWRITIDTTFIDESLLIRLKKYYRHEIKNKNKEEI